MYETPTLIENTNRILYKMYFNAVFQVVLVLKYPLNKTIEFWLLNRFAIDDPGARIDFRYIPFWAKSFEKYRWPTTMALQCKHFVTLF